MKECHQKLLSIISSYEKLLKLDPENTELISIIYITIKEDVRDKSYKSENGYKIYKLPKAEKNDEINKLLSYQKILEEKDETKETKTESNTNVLGLIFNYCSTIQIKTN